MNKEEFLNNLISDTEKLLGEYKLNNHKSQAFAWKLNASFNRTFEESYLWNRALFLSTSGCIFIQEKYNLKMATNSLYKSAEIFEDLSELQDIDKYYDKDFLCILSALCYDLAGYQANAYCIASKISSYQLITNDSDISLTVDNKILEQIHLILMNKIPYANQLLDHDVTEDIGFSFFINGIRKWYNCILKLTESDYLIDLNAAYKYYLDSNNVYLSHLLFLLITRIQLFQELSIWENIKQNRDIENSNQWKKYIKLLANDYYSNYSIKDVRKRNSKFELWTSQKRAIEKNVINLEENFVVQMPTSAGKTFIAELSILKYLVKYPEKRCIYIAPFRALTNEKEEELSKYFSKLGFSVSSLSGAYEIDEFQDVIMTESDLLIATPEKVDMLLRLNADFFNSISFIVVDEGHIIGDISTRATLLEFLIIRLRIKIPDIKILFISAVMPPLNADEYSLWLSGKTNNVLRSLKFVDSNNSDEWEPTRKLISYFEWSGKLGNILFQNVITEDEETKIKQGAILYSFLKKSEFSDQFPNPKNKKETAACLAYKLSEEGNTLVFCAQLPRIKSVALSLLKLLSIIDNENRFPSNFTTRSAHFAKIWYGETSYVTISIARGIGIHYGDMPEQVRTAVEEDFRIGNLKILLSTNTIGQGLNFPIKNLIFYSTQIGKGSYIQNRDFWNIVGRAGRAGLETEGKIVFIIQTANDRKLYKNYIDKANIEDADSFIFKVLDALVDKRISSTEFSEFISILSETYLMDLLTEEVVETEHEALISAIIENSLFKIQTEKNGIDITPLKQSFKAIFNSFHENASKEQLFVYKITGLSFRSNQKLFYFINENFEYLQSLIISDDYLAVFKTFLNLLSNGDIAEMKDNKLDQLPLNTIQYNTIIEYWLGGMEIFNIIEYWNNEIKEDIAKFHILISKGFYYLYPWGVTSFLMILAHSLKMKFSDLPLNIRNLPSYTKYGISIPTCCLARSLGVKSRSVSFILYHNSNMLSGKEFIRWLANLTDAEIDTYDITSFDKENLRDVIRKLTPISYRTPITQFDFQIKGTFFNAEWSQNSKIIQVDDELLYKREEDNIYDPYAILIKKGDLSIGYVPKEYSKIIASEMDIEETKYKIIVSSIDVKKTYNEISVKMINISILEEPLH